MTLTQEDIELIKGTMADWLIEHRLSRPSAVHEIELRERLVRIEEALKHQRELTHERLARMEKRLEQLEKRL